MSKKVIFKENVSTIATMSPLAGAVAFAMALPGLAAAETFNISSQAELDAAVTSVNTQSAEGEGGPKGKVIELDPNDRSHSITFSSSLSGQTLDLPSLYIEDGMTLEIDGSGAPGLTLNMTAESNYSSHIYTDDYAETSISNVTLSFQRSASEEGEGFIYGSPEAFEVRDGSHLTLDDVKLNLNSENGNVSGIYAGYRSYVTIQDSSLVGGGIQEKYEIEGSIYEAYLNGAFDDFVPRYSEALHSSNLQTLNINNTTITGFSTKYGAVLEIDTRNYGEVSIVDSTITGNQSTNAPLMDLYVDRNGRAIITGSSVSKNQSSFSTLQLDGDDSEVLVSNSSINKNTVTGSFPEQYSFGYVEGVVSMASVSDDTDFIFGNVTIARNKGASAIYANDYDINELVLAHVTIADNDTRIEGEGGSFAAPAVYVEASNSVDVVNSIISGNTGVDFYENKYNSSIEYSLIGSVQGYGADYAIYYGVYNLEGVDPKLTTLSGSGSRAGMRLQTGSPAIDAGTDSFFADFANLLDVSVDELPDQSGLRARIVGNAPDMGAFEWTKPSAGAAPGNPSTAESGGGFGNIGFGFLSSMFALGWLRRKLKK